MLNRLRSISRSLNVDDLLRTTVRYPVLDPVFNAYMSAKTRLVSPAEPVFVSAVPRSGSTLLSEVLNTIEDTCVLWEPFNSLPPLESSSDEKKIFLPPDRCPEEIESHIRKLFSGHYLNFHMTAHMSVSEFLFASRYVIKACRASRMLPWLIRNTGIDEGLVLVRHPCAVVSSMKKHGNWDPLLPTESPYPEIPGQLMNEFKILEKYRIRNENNELTAEEKLGLDWAIDHLVIQNTVFPDTWRIVTYEDLVIRGRDVIEKLFNWLRFPVQEKTVKKAKEKLNMPSRTARESSPPLAENRQLTKYQRHLSEEEIERVLTILDDLNISFYDASPAPNRDELRDLQIASLLL